MTSTPLIRNSLAQNFLHIPSNKHTHTLSPALFPRLSHASLTQSRQDRLPQKVISQSTPPLQSLIVICSYLPFPQYRLRFVCAIIFMPSSELFSSTLPTTLSSVTNYTIVLHQSHHLFSPTAPGFSATTPLPVYRIQHRFATNKPLIAHPYLLSLSAAMHTVIAPPLTVPSSEPTSSFDRDVASSEDALGCGTGRRGCVLMSSVWSSQLLRCDVDWVRSSEHG
jgi:hypothetical protein